MNHFLISALATGLIIALMLLVFTISLLSETPVLIACSCGVQTLPHGWEATCAEEKIISLEKGVLI